MKTTEDEALKKMWTGTFKKHLVGKKITNIRYMTEKEKVDWMWSHCAIVIELDDGQRLIPWADDEGNDAGSLYVHNSKAHDEILPVIQMSGDPGLQDEPILFYSEEMTLSKLILLKLKGVKIDLYIQAKKKLEEL